MDKVNREMIRFQHAHNIPTWDLISANVIPPPPIVQPNLLSVFNRLSRILFNQNRVHPPAAILQPPNGLVPTLTLIQNVRASLIAAYGGNA